LRTLREAAAELGITPDTLRAQIQRGRLRAVKVGRDWLVDPAELERYRVTSLRRSQPPRPGDS
jgi:excisionase family DNA binding protein